MRRETVPRGEDIPSCNGAVRLCQPVDMHGVQVEGGHLFEEMGGGRAGGDGYLDGGGQGLGFFGCAEEGVDCGGGVEVGDSFFFEELPDQGVVDLA